jgi:hypothetical protein
LPPLNILRRRSPANLFNRLASRLSKQFADKSNFFYGKDYRCYELSDDRSLAVDMASEINNLDSCILDLEQNKGSYSGLMSTKLGKSSMID